MLRLLLFLSFLLLLPHAQPAERVDLSSCPIQFCGKSFSEVSLEYDQTSVSVYFEGGLCDPSVTKECLSAYGPITPPTLPTEASPADIPRLEATYHVDVPSITPPLLCEVSFTAGGFIVKFMSFGTGLEMALCVDSTSGKYTVTVYVDGQSALPFTVDSTATNVWFGYSGCRGDSGDNVGPGGHLTSTDPMTCEREVCTEPSETDNVLTRTDSGGCQGDGTFTHDSVCTVIGNAVIGFTGLTFSVPNRCKYTLISTADLTTTATFKERHLTKPSFIDCLEITELPTGAVIQFHQDGRVEVNGVSVTLANTPQTHGGTTGMLSRDRDGITYGGYDFRIVFDGNSAEFTYFGSATELAGLDLAACNDIMNVDAYKDSTDPTCEDLHTDPDEATYLIDCSTTLPARCDLLNAAAFTPCHGVVDRTPYITACRNTLCRYPPIDGFNCQFLVNYGRRCSDRGVTLKDWGASVGCDTPGAFCGEEICLDHEYCGMTSAGRTGCFCRGDFSKTYREAGSYGGELECDASSATLTLYGCFLDERGIDSTRTHLNDEMCTGIHNETTKEVTLVFTSTNTCMATVEYVDMPEPAQVKYTNVVRHSDDLTFSFSCRFDQPADQVAFFTVTVGTLNPGVIVRNVSYTIMTMAAFDPGLTQPVTDMSAVSLDQRIWVKISVDDQDSNLMALVTDSCYLVNQDTSAIGSLTYPLIQNGCPVDPTTITSNFGKKHYNAFCFNMFQFIGHTGQVKLICKVYLCAPGSPKAPATSCVPNCSASSRRRRSAMMNEDEDPALISVTWTHL